MSQWTNPFNLWVICLPQHQFLCVCALEWVPGGVVCCSGAVHFSKWDHLKKMCCVSVCLKSVTIFITSGQIIQSLVSADPARWNASNFRCASPVMENHGHIFQRDQQPLSVLLAVAACFFLGGEIMESASHMGLPCPRKTMWKGQFISAVW